MSVPEGDDGRLEAERWERLPRKVVEHLAAGGPWGFNWECFDPAGGASREGAWFRVAEPVRAAMNRVKASWRCDYCETPEIGIRRWFVRTDDEKIVVDVQSYAWDLVAFTMEEAERLVRGISADAARELRRRDRRK